MNRPSPFAPPFRLGEWTVQPALNRVSGPDGEVRLEPRVMAVLVRLAEAPGQVVSRLDLLDQVWGDAVVGEEILTRAVSELRRIFGDRAREPRYIETIINNGYRLIAPVERLPEEEPEPAAAAPAAVPDPAPAPVPPPAVPDREPAPELAATVPLAAVPAEAPAAPPPSQGGLRQVMPWILAVLAVVAVVVTVVLRSAPHLADKPASLPSAGARAVPVTAYPGHERQPAVTADGLRVAFAWAGPEGDQEGIWVKQRNAETPLRLSRGPGLAAWPAWSPDGQTVAFVALRGGRSQLRTVPSIGGAERTLLEVAGSVVGLDWAPDGSALAFAARDTGSGVHRLMALDPATLQVRTLGPAAQPGGGEVQPRYSADGRRLAWIVLGTDGTSSLWVGDPDGGDGRQVLAGRAGLAGLAWSADGQSLVVGIDHAGTFGLWTVPLDGARPRRLTEAAEFAWNPAVARGTGELVYEQVRVDQDLWRIRILGRDPWQLATSRFLASTRWEYAAAYSPDGTRVAVVSARSGSPELWVCNAEGGDLQRLTDTGEAAVARPRWSPDGRTIAFQVRDWDRVWTAEVPAGGGPVREVAAAEVSAWDRTPDAAGGSLPPDLAPADRDTWSRAGDEAFWVMRTGGQAFLMVRGAGAAADAVVTDLPGYAGGGLTVAPDGSAVIYPRLGAAEGDLMRLVNP